MGSRDGLHSDLTERLIGAAIQVHSALGPGLLESTYAECLAHELKLAGLRTKREVFVPVAYKELHIENAFRLDLVVEGKIAVELKAVEKLLPIHTAQLLTYLRLSGLRVGLLLNFNTRLLKNGIQRIAI
jgi:GxxExxY protein